MSIDSLEKPISIDIITDAGFKNFEFIKVDTVTSYNDILGVLTEKVRGFTTFEGDPAHLIIQIHYYNGAPKLLFDQKENMFDLIYNVSATLELINEFKDFINPQS